MSEKKTSRHGAPAVQRAPQRSVERDTLPAIDQLLFAREQRGRLSSPPALIPPGHALRGTEFDGQRDDAEPDDDRDTEPSVDAWLLRAAFLAAGRSA